MQLNFVDAAPLLIPTNLCAEWVNLLQCFVFPAILSYLLIQAVSAV